MRTEVVVEFRCLGEVVLCQDDARVLVECDLSPGHEGAHRVRVNSLVVEWTDYKPISLDD